MWLSIKHDKAMAKATAVAIWPIDIEVFIYA